MNANFPFDIVGFDLDGTLLDTAPDLGAALNHVLVAEGLPAVTLAQVRNLVGGGTRKMLLRALELLDAPRDEAEVARMNTAIIARYEAHIAVHSALFAGGAAMLDALAARGVALAVVTNKMEHLARQLLDALGLSSRFFTIIGGDTLGPGRAKPAPDLLHLMALRSGLASPRVAFVGDTTFDTRAAQAAGWPCVVVRFGYCDAPPEDMGGTAIIGHFDELVPALEGLPG